MNLDENHQTVLLHATKLFVILLHLLDTKDRPLLSSWHDITLIDLESIHGDSSLLLDSFVSMIRRLLLSIIRCLLAQCSSRMLDQCRFCVVLLLVMKLMELSPRSRNDRCAHAGARCSSISNLVSIAVCCVTRGSGGSPKHMAHLQS